MKVHALFKLLTAFMLIHLSANAYGLEKQDHNQVLKDFSIEYKNWDVGVLPVRTNFIQIKPEIARSGRVFMLSIGMTTTKNDGTTDTKIKMRKKLSEAECIALFNEVKKIGFFKLKDAYSPDEAVDGGSAASLKVTADGMTKKISINNTSVPEINKLLAAINLLIR